MILIALMTLSSFAPQARAGVVAWTSGDLFSSVEEADAYKDELTQTCASKLNTLLAETEQPRANEDYAAWRDQLFRAYSRIAPRSELYFSREVFDQIVPPTRPAYWTLLTRYGPQRAAHMVPAGPHTD